MIRLIVSVGLNINKSSNCCNKHRGNSSSSFRNSRTRDLPDSSNNNFENFPGTVGLITAIHAADGVLVAQNMLFSNLASY
jgi:hypothetical protein